MTNFLKGELVYIENDYFTGNYIINDISCIDKQYLRYNLSCLPECDPDPFQIKNLYELNFRPQIPVGHYVNGSDQNFSYFGQSVDINSGNYVAVSAPKENFDDNRKNVGAVYIYKNTRFWQWELVEKLYGSYPFGNFGHSLKLNYSGDKLFVGEPYYGGVDNASNKFNYQSGYGAVYVFNKTTDIITNKETWILEKLLTGNGEFNSNFGYSIDIDKHGDKLIVGAPHQTGFSTKGRVFVYGKTNNWNLLLSGDFIGSTLYGDSVAISKDGNDFITSYHSEPINKIGFLGFRNNTLTLTADTVGDLLGDTDPHILNNRHILNYNNYIKVLNNNKFIFGNVYGSGEVKIMDYTGPQQSNPSFEYQNFSNPFSSFGTSFGVNENENLIFIGNPNENAVYYYSGNYDGNVLNITNSGKISYNTKNKYNNNLCIPPFNGIGYSIASKNNNYVFGAPLTYYSGKDEFIYNGKVYIIKSNSTIPTINNYPSYPIIPCLCEATCPSSSSSSRFISSSSSSSSSSFLNSSSSSSSSVCLGDIICPPGFYPSPEDECLCVPDVVIDPNPSEPQLTGVPCGEITLSGYAFYKQFADTTVQIPGLSDPVRVTCGGGHRCDRTFFAPKLIYDFVEIPGLPTPPAKEIYANKIISLNNRSDGGDREDVFSFLIPSGDAFEKARFVLECSPPAWSEVIDNCHDGVTFVVLTVRPKGTNRTFPVFSGCVTPGEVVNLNFFCSGFTGDYYYGYYGFEGIGIQLLDMNI